MVRIPSEYQKVEYLESTGTQWIDTGYIPNENSGVDIEYSFSGGYAYGEQVMCGTSSSSYTANNTTGFTVELYNINKWYCAAGGKAFRNLLGGIGAQLYVKHHVTLTKVSLVVDGNEALPAGSAELNSNNPCFLFAINANGTGAERKTTSTRLHSVRFYEGNQTVRNFIPCYRKTDQEPGMYDTVTGTFFTNSGTGTFFVGNDVHYSNVNLMESRRRILLNTPHIKSLSGSALSFRTDVPYEMKECKIHFSPVQEGSGTPSPENVRPITGWDGVEMTVCGKNLCPAANGFEIRNWEYYSQGRKYVITGFPPNTPMTLSVTVTKELGTASGRRLYLIGKTSAFIDTGTIGQKSLTVNTNDDGKITISQNNTMLNTDEYAEVLQNIQLELGSEATDYEPYTAQTLAIPFPRTIYGGYVDLAKGEVVEEYAILDLKDHPFKQYGSTNHCWNSNFLPSTLRYGNAVGNMLKCDSYRTLAPASILWNGSDLSIWTYNTTQSRLIIRNDSYITDGAYDINALNESLNGVMVAYPLRNPLSYQLTDPPSIPSTLRGLNNILTNANEISISFWSH